MSRVFYNSRMPRIVSASGKIYDITHADTAEHSVALPAGYPANTRILIVQSERIAGTGTLKWRPVSGQTTGWYQATGTNALMVRATNGLFYYVLSVANDDWDVYAIGYITGPL